MTCPRCGEDGLYRDGHGRLRDEVSHDLHTCPSAPAHLNPRRPRPRVEPARALAALHAWYFGGTFPEGV